MNVVEKKKRTHISAVWQTWRGPALPPPNSHSRKDLLPLWDVSSRRIQMSDPGAFASALKCSLAQGHALPREVHGQRLITDARAILAQQGTTVMGHACFRALWGSARASVTPCFASHRCGSPRKLPSQHLLPENLTWVNRYWVWSKKTSDKMEGHWMTGWQ